MKRTGALSRRLLLCAAAAALTACATSTTQLQTARTLPPGDFEVAVAGSLPLHTAFVGALADTTKAAYQRAKDAEGTKPLTEAEVRQIMEASAAAVLFTPSPVFEIGGRVGLLPRLDLGLRYGGPKIEADVKLQLQDGGLGGLDVALAGVFAHHTGIGPSSFSMLYDVAEYFKLADYGREDAGGVLILSSHLTNHFSVFGGIRYVASFVDVGGHLEKVEAAAGVPPTDMSSVMHTYGGTLGLQVGGGHFWVNAELTVARVHFAPVILGERFDLGGLLFSPGVSLALRF